MNCTHENCKNYEDLWCKGLNTDNKTCFEPVSQGQDGVKTAPGEPVAGPGLFEGGELTPLPQKPQEPPKDSEKHALNHAIEEAIKLRKALLDVIDKHLDGLLKRAK